MSLKQQNEFKNLNYPLLKLYKQIFYNIKKILKTVGNGVSSH